MRWLQHFMFGGTLPVLTDDSKQAAEARANHRLSSEKQQLQGAHKVIYDAVGELSPGLSEEAFSTLCEDARALELNQITLNFCNSAVEAEFQQHVAIRRRPVLLLVFCFDVVCYLFRMAAKFVRTDVSLAVLCKGIMPQLCNMGLLYFFLGLLNRRSRRLGDSAARQEEFLLTGVMTLAICNLLATINEMNPQDYVYAAMFMISTTCFLKIQWLLGTAFMSLPLLITHLWHKNSNILPTDAMVHLSVSWAVGGFMSYLSDTYRRQMFVNHRLAKIAAQKELQEAQARIDVQQQLSAAQAQAAQRAIVVARERAANEAKSEFMSLMCHEVRTPLNGCLASAEMLLEMPLQEEQRELAKTIRVSGSILLSTVSNFLDFFKMEAGKQLDVVRTEMTTKDLVGDIHCIIEATIGRSSSVMLERPNTDGVPNYVLGDPDRLRGILLNLYTNAAKFTRRGSIALRVRVAHKGYRPSPGQVIAQQQRGPHARLSGNKQHAGAHQPAAEQDGQCQQPAAWGSINRVSPQKKPANYEQARSQRVASGLSQASAADSDNALTRASEQWRKGPGAQAATNAGMVLRRGHHAEDAANAINQTQGITTPVQCEHVAGHALLQHAAQAMDSAADKLQADAGLSPVASRSERGFKLPASDPLEPVQEDADDTVQAASRQGAEVAELAMTKSQDAVSAQGCQSHRQSRHAPLQHAGAPAMLSKSSSGRVSSTSVLDQQDDWSSCSGGSAPSDSRAPPPDADRQSTEAQRQSAAQALKEDTIQRDSTDAPDRAHTVRPRSSLQGRHSGGTRSPLGERTQSNSDITESDTSFRCSSGSFSDYPTPLRKSLSSPALREAAVAGRQNATPSGQRHSLGGLTATSYNGMSSEKATVGKTVATTVQNLGDGWFNTVAHRKAPILMETLHSDKTSCSKQMGATDQVPDSQQPSAFQGPISPADPVGPTCDSDEWLVFEVTDTGCGISQHALSSLFTEYVQGTEDDMKRPRTRGGTGLGLSICSKQVSVLGGLLGAMSKVGEGSTFWFTIPLLKPTQSFTRESLSMRRTASWGSRDAFTDGHISHHADPPSVPAGRRTLAATTRAHRHKRHYTPARSANYQVMQQQQDPLALQRTPSMVGPEHVAGNLMQRHFPSEEAGRRMSAPAAPQDRAESGEIPRKACGMQSAASNNSTMGSQCLEQTTAQARAAVARAVLCPQPSATLSGSSSTSSHSGKLSSCISSQDSLESAALPERKSAECDAPTSQPCQHRDADGRGEGTMPRNDLQRNLLAQYKANSEGSRVQAKAAEGTRVDFGRGQPLQPLPEGSPSPFQAQDGEMLQRRAGENGFGPGRGPCSSDSGSRELNMRPSMEARRRRLGLSALQGRSVLLAEDNLINQRVAKMMLCSLGMCCEVAANGQEAVDAVLQRIGREDMRQFDVLLMDMAMPVMGGVDATKEIRRAGAAVPIVAMTANSSDKDRDECLEAGMDGFLSKPVLKDRLAEAILNAVSGRRQFQDRQTISLKAYDRL